MQVDALVAGHFAIHEGAEDAVHQTRVACRRLRSTLSTFEYCFDADAAEALRYLIEGRPFGRVVLTI